MKSASFFSRHRGRRLRFPAALLVVLAAGAGVAFGGGKPSTDGLTVEQIKVDAAPLTAFDPTKPAETRFGKLTWKGGLVLTSTSPYFGGWSGIRLDGEGRNFLAVSDAGIWMTGALDYSDGAPAGISDASVGAIQSKDGDALSRGKDRDAEGLALISGTPRDGSVYISFERKHRISRYDVGPDGLSPARGKVVLPEDAKDMPGNGGFEGIAVIRGDGPNSGKLVAFSEELRDSDGNYTAWIWEADDKPLRFHMTNDGDYAVTDVAPLPDGGLLVLERRFRLSEGVRMRLRHIHAEQLKPGAIIDADILVAADGRSNIDNIEGLSVNAGPDGELIVTMISDNNYNPAFQRTLLLQFSLKAADIASVAGGSKNDQP
ncbi:hypothetical protein APY04_2403 [Hyphomicrobium sulfonivorans]|uniref:Phytase-like domain-containing protein n=1 Tax=Hyphomicrobium sulfonivorans TaxID=121290 RepID=A0A120CUH2_HYPSL|nr:esterase-like activity of phytase family protein [Hyphomicrobium sulfonivorans]KWT66207.1 hypothetical protein APY04_2403 [Hyphomicrobium sulfonivorans]